MTLRAPAIALLLAASSLSAQTRVPLTGADCGQKVGTPCTGTWITEATFGTRLANSDRHDPNDYFGYHDDGTFHYAMTFGFVEPVAPRIALGGLVSAGVKDGDLYLLIGPRLRYHLSNTAALDVTPGYMLERGQSVIGPLMLDAAVMYKDKIGLSAQLSHGKVQHWGTYDPNAPSVMTEDPATTLHLGARLGSVPGMIGIGSGFLATIAALAIIAAVGFN